MAGSRPKWRAWELREDAMRLIGAVVTYGFALFGLGVYLARVHGK